MANDPSMLDRAQVEQLVRKALRDRLLTPGSAPTSAIQDSGSRQRLDIPSKSSGRGPNPLVVNVSARHAHVTQEHLELLFGPGTKLTKLKDLYQQGEFASEQQINVIGPRNRMIPGVRILGPTRDYTQVELAYTDGIFLGIDLPLRTSGDHKNTIGCTLVGPYGAITIRQGVIRAERHVHMHPDDATHYGVKDADYMKLKIEGPCGVTFDRVKVRVNPRVKLEVHIDTDEGNACHVPSAVRMELMK